jgi:hypothetical protein
MKKETIRGVLTKPILEKKCKEIINLIEKDKKILNNHEYISMMKEYNFIKNK